MLNTISKKILSSPIWWLFVISIIAYWQIAFAQYSLCWDNLDVVFPWRYHVGESIQHGVFPFWNPYLDSGYPIYGDLRSVFNPEMWLIGCTTGYSIYTIHLLMMLAFFLSGVGMYKLSFYFTRSQKAAFLVGIVYMLSGYMVQQSQDLPRILAACWLPFALLYFFKLCKSPSFKNALLTSFFYYLMISGGYMPVSFMLFYVFLGVFIYYFFIYYRNKDRRSLLKLFIYGALSAVVAFLLLLPNLISYIQMSTEVARFSGLDLKLAEVGHFPVKDILTLIIPFSSAVNPEMITDISMRNIYIGLIPFIFMVIGLFQMKSKKNWVFFIVALLFLSASFGKEFVVHRFLFDHVPLMNLFRFPSYFSLFTILFFSLILGNYIAYLINRRYFPKKEIFFVLSVVGTGIVVLILIHFQNLNKETFTFFDDSLLFSQKIRQSVLSEHIVLQGLVQLTLLLLYISILLIWKNFKKRINLSIVFVILEMVLAVQFQIHYTGLNRIAPEMMHAELKSQPRTFILPNLNRTISENNAENPFASPLWHNIGVFTKRPSSDGFNSFQLQSHDDLRMKYPKLKNYLDQQALAYLSDSVFTDYEEMISSKYNNLNGVWLEDTVSSFSVNHKKNNGNDSILIERFDPDHFKFVVNSSSETIFVLQQTFFKYWQATLNGEPVKILPVNLKEMGIIIPDGVSEIEFRFKNGSVEFATYFSLFFFILLSVILLFIINKRPVRYYLSIGFLILVIFVLLTGSFHNSINQNIHSLPKEITEYISDNPKQEIIINTDLITNDSFSDKVIIDRLTENENFQQIHRNGLTSDTVVLFNYRLKEPSVLSAFLKKDYRQSKVEQSHLLSKYEYVRGEQNDYIFERYLHLDSASNVSLLEEKYDIDNYSKVHPQYIKLDTTELYAFIIDLPVDQLKGLSPINISMSAEFFETETSRLQFIFSHRRNENLIHWESEIIRSFIDSPNKWCFATMDFDYYKEIKEGDKIEVYLWNENRGVYLVRNLSFRINKTPN